MGAQNHPETAEYHHPKRPSFLKSIDLDRLAKATIYFSLIAGQLYIMNKVGISPENSMSIHIYGITALLLYAVKPQLWFMLELFLYFIDESRAESND